MGDPVVALAPELAPEEADCVASLLRTFILTLLTVITSVAIAVYFYVRHSWRDYLGKAIDAAWNSADLDKDGFVTPGEIWAGTLHLTTMVPVHIRPPTRAYVNDITAKLDHNEQGHLNREQFVLAMRFLSSNILRRVVLTIAIYATAPFVGAAVYQAVSFRHIVSWLPDWVQCLSASLDTLQLWPPLLAVVWMAVARIFGYRIIDNHIAEVTSRQSIALAAKEVVVEEEQEAELPSRSGGSGALIMQ